MQQYIRYGGITLLLLILQTTIIPFTSIAGIIPDVMLVWLVYIALQTGQISATVAGCTIGLVLDLVSGQFLGLSALSKTVAGFFAGYFYNNNKVNYTIATPQFIIITAAVSFAHNILYFILFLQGSDVGLFTAIFRFGLFATLYTTALACFPMFVFSRKNSEIV